MNFNVADGSYNININGSTLESSILINTTNISILQNKVDYEIREIHAMNSSNVVSKVAEFPPGIFKLYSDLDVPNIYNKTEVSTLLDTKQNLLDSGSNFNIDVGRGNVQVVNSTHDNVDGAGITLKVSNNPTNGGMFAVRSSGGAARLWVGQSLTSSGLNDFGIWSSNGTTGDMSVATAYSHLFKQNSASLKGPVDITGDLTITGDFTAPNIYNKTEVSTLISNSGGGGGSSITRITESTNFTDIAGGAYGIRLKDGNTVLLESNASFLTSHVNFSAPNVYTKTEVDAKHNIIAFDCYNSSISGTFTTSARTVNLDSIRYNSGQFSITPGTGIITVSQDMTVQVIFRITTDVSHGTSRSVSRGYLELNNTFVAGSYVYMYNRQSSHGESTACCSVILSLSNGDELRTRAVRIAGVDTLRFANESCAMTITKL